MLFSSRAWSRCNNSSRCFRGSPFLAASNRRFSSSWITRGSSSSRKSSFQTTASS